MEIQSSQNPKRPWTRLIWLTKLLKWVSFLRIDEILPSFKEFIDLEKEIHRYEHRNVLKKYESKTIFADEIKKTVDQVSMMKLEARTPKNRKLFSWKRRSRSWRNRRESFPDLQRSIIVSDLFREKEKADIENIEQPSVKDFLKQQVVKPGRSSKSSSV